MAAPHCFPDPSPDVAAAKRAARARALATRAACDPALGAPALGVPALGASALGAIVAARVLRDCPPPPGAVVSGVWPLPGEIDPRPLLMALHARGHVVVLPVTPPRGQPLIFRRWQPGDVLVPERFGTMAPVGELAVPDFLLVPLLAFDRRGYRLGYGGGYYDRTLAALPRRFALGFGFAAQQVDALPVEPTDIKLDAVATERGIVRFKES